jgi:hypothetical protein
MGETTPHLCPLPPGGEFLGALGDEQFCKKNFQKIFNFLRKDPPKK